MKKFGLESILSFIKKMAFSLIYSLTVMPFTVQFFRRFVQPPSVNLKLFYYYSLADNHEFFLPIFVITFEIISVQLAIGIWRHLFQSKWSISMLLFAIFCMFQFFPTFSTFFAARLYEHDQIQNREQEIEKERKVHELNEQAQAIYKDNLQKYEQNIVQSMAQYNERKNTLENQIQQDRDNLKQLSEQNERLLQTMQVGITIGRHDQIQQQVKQNEQLITEYNQSVTKRQQDLDRLLSTPPTNPEKPKLESIQLQQVNTSPNRKTDVQFVVETITSYESILAFFVSLIFPCMVLGAGYVLLDNEVDQNTLSLFNASNYKNIAILNIEHELKECSHLPIEAQKGYIHALFGVITSHVAGVQAAKQISITNSNFHLSNELEFQMINQTSSLHQQVINSSIVGNCKDELIQHINNVLMPYHAQL